MLPIHWPALRPVILFSLFFLPHALSAATITVDVNTDGAGAANECELRDAILAANTDAPVDGCSAGDGTDLINFSISMAKITLTSDLPEIGSGGLEIVGPGQKSLQITGNDLYRIFYSTSIIFTLKDLTLTDGLSSTNGGCVHLFRTFVSTVLIEDVTFDSCESTDNGGAVRILATVTGSSATIRRVTISNNISSSFGGGMSLSVVEALVEDSTFNGNSGTQGGALAIGSGTQSTVKRSTFWGNKAETRGSAITVVSAVASIVLDSSTVALNTATGTGLAAGYPGGAIYTEGSVSLANTVVANNVELNPNHSVTDLIGGGSSQIITLGFNFIGNNEGSAAVFPAGINANGDQVGTAIAMFDAKLSPLKDNGGPTQTAAPILGGSPLLDQGSCSLETRDQRGYGNPDTGLRIVDDPGFADADDGCDIGAYESLAERLDPVIVFADGFETVL